MLPFFFAILQTFIHIYKWHLEALWARNPAINLTIKTQILLSAVLRKSGENPHSRQQARQDAHTQTHTHTLKGCAVSGEELISEAATVIDGEVLMSLCSPTASIFSLFGDEQTKIQPDDGPHRTAARQVWSRSFKCWPRWVVWSTECSLKPPPLFPSLVSISTWKWGVGRRRDFFPCSSLPSPPVYLILDLEQIRGSCKGFRFSVLEIGMVLEGCVLWMKVTAFLISSGIWPCTPPPPLHLLAQRQMLPLSNVKKFLGHQMTGPPLTRPRLPSIRVWYLWCSGEAFSVDSNCSIPGVGGLLWWQNAVPHSQQAGKEAFQETKREQLLR